MQNHYLQSKKRTKLVNNEQEEKKKKKKKKKKKRKQIIWMRSKSNNAKPLSPKQKTDKVGN